MLAAMRSGFAEMSTSATTDHETYRLVEPRAEAPSQQSWAVANTMDDTGKIHRRSVDIEGFSIDTPAERALVAKIDRRIMPCLFAMIVLNYLDRNGLANARVQGIEKSLGMSGSDFSTAISVFFVGYVGLQVPSNLLITRLRPSRYLVNLVLHSWLRYGD